MSGSVKIHILHCGQVQLDEALPFAQHTVNPLASMGLFRSKKHQVRLPVSAYLIEHPRGLVLIDTGWHPGLRGDQSKIVGRLHYQITKAVLPAGQAIDEQLQKRGVGPQDLDYVILTHLHCDHVGGLQLVSAARNILTSAEEWQCAQNDRLRYVQTMWQGIDIQTFPLRPSRYGPRGRSFDLFGDDSLVFVHAPGDSLGLVATLIQREGRSVLLTSDCGYGRDSWEKMILPGIMVNQKLMRDSLLWVKSWAQDPRCIETIANHDPEVVEHIIEV